MPRPPDVIDPDTDLPATFGDYELRSLIGEGAMARVFSGVRTRSGGFSKQLAIKVIRRDRIRSNPTAFKHIFDREARLGATIDHPNVAKTIDKGEIGGCFFIALELVRGPSLETLLVEGPLPPAICLDIAIQLCRAMQAMHGRDDLPAVSPLVHRDIKPANIAIDTSGQMKLLDLGLTKRLTDSLAASSTILGPKGTPAYGSPEQFKLDGRVTPQSDIFSAGLVLFELVLGRRLIDTPDPMSAMFAVDDIDGLLADGRDLEAVDATVPGLGTILRRCLWKDPSRRPRCADELRRDLEVLAKDYPTVELADWVRSWRSQTAAAIKGLPLPPKPLPQPRLEPVDALGTDGVSGAGGLKRGSAVALVLALMAVALVVAAGASSWSPGSRAGSGLDLGPPRIAPDAILEIEPREAEAGGTEVTRSEQVPTNSGATNSVPESPHGEESGARVETEADGSASSIEGDQEPGAQDETISGPTLGEIRPEVRAHEPPSAAPDSRPSPRTVRAVTPSVTFRGGRARPGAEVRVSAAISASNEGGCWLAHRLAGGETSIAKMDRSSDICSTSVVLPTTAGNWSAVVLLSAAKPEAVPREAWAQKRAFEI